MSQLVVTTHTVRRAAFTTPRLWDDVVQAFRFEAGRTHDTMTFWKPEGTDAVSITQSIKARVGPSGLFMFIEQPLSKMFAPFAPEGTFRPKVTQFVIGDPFTGAKLYQATPRVALFAPPRIAVIELPDGKGTEVVYDVPTSVIGGENEEARMIAESADAKLERLVRSVL